MTSAQSTDKYCLLSDRLTHYYSLVLVIHGDDPAVGACLLCRVSRCDEWRFASERLGAFVEQQTEQAAEVSTPRRPESDRP